MADTTPAALAIAQILKFNCIKHNREHSTTGLEAQCCTGEPSSDIRRDDVARAYTKEGVSRQVVTPGHEHLIYPRY